VGQGAWHTRRKVTDFTATVIGDGTMFGKNAMVNPPRRKGYELPKIA
jgi:hypothetical protein